MRVICLKPQKSIYIYRLFFCISLTEAGDVECVDNELVQGIRDVLSQVSITFGKCLRLKNLPKVVQKVFI